MLISNALEQAFNEQIGHEFGASLQYVNIASYFDADDLPELAAFFYRQSDEEKMHAMKFVDYIIDAGGQVRVPGTEDSKYGFASPEEAVKAALDWEMEVTGQINTLMDMAIKENDHIAQDFLRWFVTEQLEEVSTMETLLNVVRRAKENILWVEDYLARNPIVSGPGEAAA